MKINEWIDDDAIYLYFGGKHWSKCPAIAEGREIKEAIGKEGENNGQSSSCGKHSKYWALGCSLFVEEKESSATEILRLLKPPECELIKLLLKIPHSEYGNNINWLQYIASTVYSTLFDLMYTKIEHENRKDKICT